MTLPELRAERPSAVIVPIGDELLNGDRTDTNGAWLARFLDAQGFRVRRILAVGDSEREIREGLAAALDLVGPIGVVVTTGGLGPTEDDRTREAVAALLGLELLEDPVLLAEIERRFLRRGLGALPATNRSLARIPQGAEVLPNPLGTAPGLLFDDDRRVVVLLPGVPAEMEHLATTRVADALNRRFPGRPPAGAVRVIRTTGIPESLLAERLTLALPDEPGLNLAYRPSVEGVELRFSCEGDRADTRLSAVLRRLEPVLADYRFASRSGDLAEAVLDGFRTRGWTVGLAESCTGGLVAKRLTDHPGSSDVVLGGVVSYSDQAKAALLDVQEGLIRTHGAVSTAVAEAMATGAVGRFGSTVGVAITGIAGPDGGSRDKPVGTVCFAVSGPGGVQSETRWLPGDRAEVRVRAAQHALHLLLKRSNVGNGSG